MAIKLNELVNGLRQSASPTGSGEVTKISFGDLPAEDVGTPVQDTDAANYITAQTMRYLTQAEEDALSATDGRYWFCDNTTIF